MNSTKKKIQEIGAKIALLCDDNEVLRKDLHYNTEEIKILFELRKDLIKEITQ